MSGMRSTGSLGAGVLAHAGSGAKPARAGVRALPEAGGAVCSLRSRQTVRPFAAVASSSRPDRPFLMRLYQQSAGAAAAFETRDVESVARAGQRHIEQPVALLRFGQRDPLPGALHDADLAGALDRPEERRRHPARPCGIVEGEQGLGWRADLVEQVSGRNTIGASRPFAPWTVMTRTSLWPGSMSRLISRCPLTQPAQKPLQRGRGAVVVGQCQVEELIEGIGGLGSQASQHPGPSAFAVEHRGIELERRQVFGPPPPTPQALRRLHRAMAAAALRGELLPQGSRPAERQGRQVVVVEAEQRRFERRGERKVVVGQSEHVAQRNQILHGDLLGQHQTVGAGNRHATRLQGGDQRRGERQPLAHED